MISRLARVTQRIWIMIAGAMTAAVVSVVAGVFEWWWLCIAGVTALQLSILLLLLLGVTSESARRMDALSARVMAALETERLNASDRHREIVELVQRNTRDSAAVPLEAEPGIHGPSQQGTA